MFSLIFDILKGQKSFYFLIVCCLSFRGSLEGVSEYSLESSVERSFLLIASRQRYLFVSLGMGGGDEEGVGCVLLEIFR